MGLHCVIDIESDWGFPNRTPELGIPIDYTEAITVFTDTFMEISREMVPVDTGYLRSSINCYGGGTTITAEATADYAQYVEYGTWCCQPQPYFNPAIEAANNTSFAIAKSIYDQAMVQEAEMIRQQLMNEAQSKLESAMMSIGSNPMLRMSMPSLLMIIVQMIASLFTQFFEDIFSNNKED